MLRLGRAITGIESAKKSDTARKNAKKKIGMRINMTATTVKRVGTGKPLKVIDRGDYAQQRRHRGQILGVVDNYHGDFGVVDEWD